MFRTIADRLAEEKAVKSAADEERAKVISDWVQFFYDLDLFPKEGPPGRDGAPGRDGVDGKDGANGRDGKNGVDGKNGRDGVDGKDGARGQDGARGKDGVNGRDGRNGKDGRDGLWVVRSVTLYESDQPLARVKSVTDYMSDGTTRTRTLKRDAAGRPVSLE